MKNQDKLLFSNVRVGNVIKAFDNFGIKEFIVLKRDNNTLYCVEQQKEKPNGYHYTIQDIDGINYVDLTSFYKIDNDFFIKIEYTYDRNTLKDIVTKLSHEEINTECVNYRAIFRNKIKNDMNIIHNGEYYYVVDHSDTKITACKYEKSSNKDAMKINGERYLLNTDNLFRFRVDDDVMPIGRNKKKIFTKEKTNSKTYNFGDIVTLNNSNNKKAIYVMDNKIYTYYIDYPYEIYSGFKKTEKINIGGTEGSISDEEKNKILEIIIKNHEKDLYNRNDIKKYTDKLIKEETKKAYYIKR